jgi:hypothetical protein
MALSREDPAASAKIAPRRARLARRVPRADSGSSHFTPLVEEVV